MPSLAAGQPVPLQKLLSLSHFLFPFPTPGKKNFFFFCIVVGMLEKANSNM